MRTGISFRISSSELTKLAALLHCMHLFRANDRIKVSEMCHSGSPRHCCIWEQGLWVVCCNSGKIRLSYNKDHREGNPNWHDYGLMVRVMVTWWRALIVSLGTGGRYLYTDPRWVKTRLSYQGRKE